MHRFRSNRSVFRLRFSSLCYLLFIGFVTLLILASVWGFLLYDERGVQLATMSLACSLISGGTYLVLSANLRCPLCHGPLMSNGRFARNPRAIRVLRSYRLGLATQALLLGRFRCPCCGEPCRCEAVPR